jgi:hypothetical protein
VERRRPPKGASALGSLWDSPAFVGGLRPTLPRRESSSVLRAELRRARDELDVGHPRDAERRIADLQLQVDAGDRLLRAGVLTVEAQLRDDLSEHAASRAAAEEAATLLAGHDAPLPPEAQGDYGVVFVLLDRTAEAIEALTQATSAPGARASLRLYLARALRARGDGTAAEGVLDDLLSE